MTCPPDHHGPDYYRDAYEAGATPWVIGEPQPGVLDAIESGWISGTVLDAGCGDGANAVALVRRGFTVVGVDIVPAAVDLARASVATDGVTAEFRVGDLLAATPQPGMLGFGTVLDSALLHIFDSDTRLRYATRLIDLLIPGGTLVLLAALRVDGPHLAPGIDEHDLTAAFASASWSIEDVRPAVYRGRIGSAREAELADRQIGELNEVPGLLARIRRSG